MAFLKWLSFWFKNTGYREGLTNYKLRNCFLKLPHEKICHIYNDTTTKYFNSQGEGKKLFLLRRIQKCISLTVYPKIYLIWDRKIELPEKSAARSGSGSLLSRETKESLLLSLADSTVVGRAPVTAKWSDPCSDEEEELAEDVLNLLEKKNSVTKSTGSFIKTLEFLLFLC